MKRSYRILPPFQPPWRYDLYQALFSALLIHPLAERGEGRAKELYRQAVLIAEHTKEPVSDLVWALATFESQISAAEENRLPSSHSSPLNKSSPNTAYPSSKHPKQPSLSHCLF